MKFSTVEIWLANRNTNQWAVQFSDLPGDREEKELGPQPLGFYHYPRHMGRKHAFEELRTDMIATRQRMIASLVAQIDALKSLEMGK